MSVFYANSVDPDQTPRSAASDLDLHCLLVSLLWDAIGIINILGRFSRFFYKGSNIYDFLFAIFKPGPY